MLFDAFGMGAQSFADHSTGAPLQRFSYISRLFLTGYGSNIFDDGTMDRLNSIFSGLASTNLIDTTLTWGTVITYVHRLKNHEEEVNARKVFQDHCDFQHKSHWDGAKLDNDNIQNVTSKLIDQTLA
jgi:hypothetical protein